MVVIQSKVNRNLITQAVRGIIPDALIAWAAAMVFDGGWVGFFIVLLGLQCLYFLLWLKVLIWSWLLFWISGRRKMSGHLEDGLVEGRFPRPPPYIDGATGYLSGIANDKKEDAKKRVAAAVELGTLNGIKTAGKYSLALQLQVAYEDAIEKYSKRFPPRQEPELEQLEDIEDEDE
jgi:hypothetical protein